MTNYLAVDHHCERGAIKRQHGRLRSQCPAEVDIVRSGNVSALSWSIDAAEGLRGKGVVDGDRLGSQIYLATGLIVGDGMDLVCAVPRSSGATRIREKVRKHLVAPTSPV